MATIYKQKVANEIEAIQQVMGQFPDGASIQEIKEALKNSIEIHTLRRRLGDMVATGVVRMSGERRRAKYHLLIPSTLVPSVEENKTIAHESSTVPISIAGKDILAKLATPVDKRIPVRYNRAFIDDYRPNLDYYLSETEREQLAKLTSTPGGEAQAAGTYAKHILQRLLIDLSWNSSRLEGNTYSLLETKRLLDYGEPAAEKSATDAQMLLNHKDAIEFMVAGAEEIGFNRYTLTNLHAMLANNLLPDPAAPGRLRVYPVGIINTAYTPTPIPQLIEEMFEVMLVKTSEIKNPHEQAFFIMVHLPYLQPFEDINKRVSRLAANIPLNQHNLIPISFIEVPEDLYMQGLLGIYEFNRVELLKDVFLWACARSADRYAFVRQTIGEPNLFRMKYGKELQQMIMQIITDVMDPTVANAFIYSRSMKFPAEDQDRFRELVHTELLSLHEGNFARYRVSPLEFKRWKESWLK